MNETLLSGFEDLPHSDQRALVDFCMDRNNWARPQKKKMIAAAAASAAFDAATDNDTTQDVHPEAAPSSMAAGATAGADAASSLSSANTTAVSAELKRKVFVIPKPGQDGASSASVFAGKTFVLTGVFPEVGGGTGLGMGKDRVKAMIQAFGGRVTGSISGKTDVLVVGKEPGMSKVSKARAKPKILLASIHDLKLGLDTGCEALEDFEASKREEPMLIKDFSSGYQFQATKEYNGLALQASKKDLAIAMGFQLPAAENVEGAAEAPLSIEDDPRKPAATNKRKAVKDEPTSNDDSDTKPDAKATKKRKATAKATKKKPSSTSTAMVVATKKKPKAKATKKKGAAKKKAASPAASDEEEADIITCDNCAADCTDESWFVAFKEEDYCPDCYENDKDSLYLEGAVYQRNGENVA